MRAIVIGAHLLRDDIEPIAEAAAVGDLFLSTLPIEDEQPVGDRDLLVRVAGVRARLLEVATFVAIRYGFTIRAPGDAEAKCSSHVTRWRKLLTAHRNDVEMTLKIVASSGEPRPDRKDFTSGADYLKALHAARSAAGIDPGFRAAAERLLLPLASRHRWMHRDEKSVELAALVSRDRLEEVRAAGDALRAEAAGVPFLLSGPWPLEVFTDDDHE